MRHQWLMCCKGSIPPMQRVACDIQAAAHGDAPTFPRKQREDCCSSLWCRVMRTVSLSLSFCYSFSLFSLSPLLSVSPSLFSSSLTLHLCLSIFLGAGVRFSPTPLKELNCLRVMMIFVSFSIKTEWPAASQEVMSVFWISLCGVEAPG